MNIIDLTHSISPKMPVYPGTKPPLITTQSSIDDAGFLEKKITLYSHTGTHIDAPAHLIKDSKFLNMFPISHFYGKGFLLNLALLNLAHAGKRTVDIKELKPYQTAIEQVEFLLIHTGWSQYWENEKYFSDYPVLSSDAARWLCRFKLKGVGFDTISADKADSRNYPVHKALLQNDTIIIENLTNLEKLPCNHFFFSCFPLNFEDADGSPVRAAAIIK